MFPWTSGTSMHPCLKCGHWRGIWVRDSEVCAACQPTSMDCMQQCGCCGCWHLTRHVCMTCVGHAVLHNQGLMKVCAFCGSWHLTWQSCETCLVYARNEPGIIGRRSHTRSLMPLLLFDCLQFKLYHPQPIRAILPIRWTHYDNVADDLQACCLDNNHVSNGQIIGWARCSGLSDSE